MHLKILNKLNRSKKKISTFQKRSSIYKKLLVFNLIAIVFIIIAMQQINYHYTEIGNELSYRNYTQQNKINFTDELVNTTVNLKGINITFTISLLALVVCAINNSMDLVDLHYINKESEKRYCLKCEQEI